jgi:hypothetical protein
VSLSPQPTARESATRAALGAAEWNSKNAQNARDIFYIAIKHAVFMQEFTLLVFVLKYLKHVCIGCSSDSKPSLEKCYKYNK